MRVWTFVSRAIIPRTASVLIAGMIAPLIVYAVATIPAGCSTPGDCDELTPTFKTLRTKSGAVINENSENADFRVEGDAQTHLLFTDGNTDRVGIGTNAPSTEFDVAGTVRGTYINAQTGLSSSGNLTVAGSATIRTAPLKVDTPTNAHIDLDRGSNTQEAQIRYFTNGVADGTFGHNGASNQFIVQSNNIPILINAVNEDVSIVGGTSKDLILGSNAVEKMRIDATGFVGIGEANPDGLLHLKTTDESGDLLHVEADGRTGVKVGIDSSASNHQFGKIDFEGSTDNGGDRGIGGRITANSFRDIFQANDAILQFNTTFNGGAATTVRTYTFNHNDSAQLVIDASGNVGINTVTPAAKLDVHGGIGIDSTTCLDVASDRIFHDTDCDGTQDVGEGFIDASTGGNPTIADADTDTQVQTEETGNENKIRFDTAGAERMIIDENGNVGIGETNPSNLLYIKTTSDSGDLILLEADGRNGVKIGVDSVINNHQLGKIDFEGSTDSGGDRGIGGRITANTLQDVFQANDGIMQFNTTFNGGAATTARTYTFNHNDSAQLVIDASGNVGIGNTSPQRTLHISNTMRIEPQSSPPASPALGDLYVDSDSTELCFYNGLSWTGLVAGGACS